MAQSSAPVNPRDELITRARDIGQRLADMAAHFPEEKYDFRASQDVRRFGEQLRHVAFWNIWASKMARGESMDTSANELPKAEYGTRDAIVKALRSATDDLVAELQRQPPQPSARHTRAALSFVAHSSEHYGQLVVYYRLNGLVPPASRLPRSGG